MKFEIDPYVRAGPIALGMSQPDVQAILGSPSRSSKAFNGDVNWTYDLLYLDVGFSKKNQAVHHIGLSGSAEVFVDGIDVFRDSSAMTKLMSRDGEPFKYVGFIVLLHLGIMLGGFDDDEDASSRTIAAFSRGRWDERQSKFVPLTSKPGAIDQT
ncbi:MAG TPA: hypothetical protein PK402_03120 [Tepidisphaeraceae bacterium]|nr:hypothetical protein [Tepidisphaeraceae bacterium]